MVEKIGLAATMDMGSFNTGMGQYNRGLDSMTGKTEKSAGILKTALGFISGQAIIGGVKAVVNGIKDMAQEAASVPAIAGQFERLGGSIEAMRAGSAGLIKDTDLMKNFNKAASLVSVDFAKKLPDAMSLLNRAAAASGQDVGFMLDSLVTGVGRVSPMILDNLGIQVSLSEATEAYAASIGKSVKELSKEEQQTAVMNVVMDKLQASYGGMEDVSKSAAAKMAAFGIQMENFKTTVGVAVLPIITEFMGVLSRMAADLLPKVTAALDNMRPVFETIGTVIGTIPDVLRGTGGDIPWEDMLPPWLADVAYTVSDAFAALQPLIQNIISVISGGASWETLFPPKVVAIAQEFGATLGTMAKTVMGAVSGLLPVFKSLGTTIMGAFSKLAPVVQNLFGKVFSEQVKTLGTVFNTVFPEIIKIVQTVMQAMQAAIQKAVPVVIALFEMLAPKITAVFEIIRRIVADVVPFVSNLIQKMVAFALQTFGTLISWVQANMPLISQTITTVLNAIQTIWNTVWPVLKVVVLTVWEVIKTAISTALNVILGIIKLAMQVINGDWTGAWESFKKIITDALSGVFTIVQTLLGGIATLIGGKIGEFIQLGADLIGGFVQGIKDKTGMVLDAIKALVAKIPEAVRKLLGIASPSKVFIQIGESIGEGLAIGIEASSDSALKAVLDMTDSIVNLVQGMIEAINSMASAPATGNLAAWGKAIAETLQMVIDTLTGMYDTAGGPKASAIDLTRRLAKQFEDVTAFLGDIADAVGALAEVDLSKVTAAKITEFMARVHDILQAIVTESATWGATDAEIKANFATARKLTDQILDVVRIVTPSVEAVNAILSLSDFSGDDLRKAMYQWSWVETAILYITQNLALIAARLDMTGYAAAVEFSETVGKIIGIVEPAVSAISTLAGAIVEDLRGAAYKWSWVITGVLIIADNIKALAVGFDAKAYEAAISFSETVGKVLVIVGDAVNAIADISKFEPATNLSSALDIDNPQNIFSQLDQLLSGLRWYAGQWGDTAEEVASRFEQLSAFVGPVVEGLGLIRPVVDAIAAMASYAPAANLARMLDIDNPENIFSQLDQILTGLRWYAEQWGSSAEEVAGKFATLKAFVGPVVEGLALIKPVIDAVAAMASYTPAKGLPMKILAFADDLDTILAGLREIAARWVTASDDTFTAPQLAAIAVFSTNVQTAIGFIKPAIDAIDALAKYAAAKGLGKAIAAFEIDLTAAIEALGRLAANPALSVEALGTLGQFSSALVNVIADLQAAVEALATVAGYKSGAAVGAFQKLEVDLNSIFIVLWRMATNLSGDMGIGRANAFEAAAIAIHDAMVRAFEKLGIISSGGTSDAGAGFASGIASALGVAKSAITTFRGAWVSDWAAIASAVTGATTEVKRFAAAVSNLDIPAAMEGHSPPPLAKWLGNIADAARQAKEQFAAMGGGMRSYALPSTVAATQAAAAVANNVNVNMGGVSITNGMDQALFEARVRRIVKEAIRA